MVILWTRSRYRRHTVQTCDAGVSLYRTFVGATIAIVVAVTSGVFALTGLSGVSVCDEEIEEG